MAGRMEQTLTLNLDLYECLGLRFPKSPSQKTWLSILTLIFLLFLPLFAHAQTPPSATAIAELSMQWVDPVTVAPPGTTYHLFDTTSRGKGTQGSYLIYLPPTYATANNRRYPVIYWLHGGFGNAREGSWAVEQIDKGVKAGLMPETIVVLAQALPVGWYVNSKDGKRPVEDVIIKDLIPHIDAAYRTLNQREARGIEGMSMGGYGALHLGVKYPDLFGAISSVAPSIMRNLSDEPKERTFDTFGDDQAFYDANGPCLLAKTERRRPSQWNSDPSPRGWAGYRVAAFNHRVSRPSRHTQYPAPIHRGQRRRPPLPRHHQWTWE